MKTLKAWLDEERGRYTALAAHLGVSVGRVSQIADDGVPPKFMLMVRDFTKDAVSLEAMVAARTPGSQPSEPNPDLAHGSAAQSPQPERRKSPDRRKVDRRADDKPCNHACR
jgi:hypothetical protein